MIIKQSLVFDRIYFLAFSSVDDSQLNISEIRELIPQDQMHLFERSYQVGTKEYLGACQHIGIDPINIHWLIDENYLEILRQNSRSIYDGERLIVENLMRLAMVIDHGNEILGKEYNKDELLKDVSNRITRASNLKNFSTKNYEEILYILMKTISA